MSSSTADEKENSGSGLTLTVLGCGALGTAILSGILSSLSSPDPDSSSSTESKPLPPRIPTKFIACNRTAAHTKKIHDELSHFNADLEILEDQNVRGVKAADIILLGCEPHAAKNIFSQEGMATALEGKLIISILAGVPVSALERMLPKAPNPDRSIFGDYHQTPTSPKVVRVLPNTASLIRESMTIIQIPEKPLPAHLDALVTWMFERIGRVVHLPASLMDASTALCGSGPAFMAVVVEAMADGAVAMGLPRAEAQMMAAQVMKGTAGMVLNGEHPALVKEKVGTPGGCTMGGLMILEEKGVRGAVTRAVREATTVVGQLGKGLQGVNRTRF